MAFTREKISVISSLVNFSSKAFLISGKSFSWNSGINNDKYLVISSHEKFLKIG